MGIIGCLNVNSILRISRPPYASSRGAASHDGRSYTCKAMAAVVGSSTFLGSSRVAPICLIPIGFVNCMEVWRRRRSSIRRTTFANQATRELTLHTIFRTVTMGACPPLWKQIRGRDFDVCSARPSFFHLNWEMPDSAPVDNRRQPAACSLTADVDSAFGCEITLCLPSSPRVLFKRDDDRGFPTHCSQLPSAILGSSGV
ncbi:uncharacterized protein B0T15DRAFT_6924 [Chaetomium strumarium]|uniref:Uncharacterized protein n=1 Tax=Chaetomium strumarium TaxID=1170767 RepID=A0AAJ0H0H3_9PEZI|nr:hypothetical protein B0T15DRAFT_6924 [Chaetomium strumarium]